MHCTKSMSAVNSLEIVIEVVKGEIFFCEKNEVPLNNARLGTPKKFPTIIIAVLNSSSKLMRAETWIIIKTLTKCMQQSC